jgi:predicted Zn-ribbon and HTH transcriptional regulator
MTKLKEKKKLQRKEWETTLSLIQPPEIDRQKDEQLSGKTKTERRIQYMSCPKCGQETTNENIRNAGQCGRCWYKENWKRKVRAFDSLDAGLGATNEPSR